MFCKYLCVDNVDEYFICIRIFVNIRIIYMNSIFPHPHGHPQCMYTCIVLVLKMALWWFVREKSALGEAAMQLVTE